jgi:hypothetical protein
MTDLAIPTIQLRAEIRYFDERPLSGRIFLPQQAAHHEGPTRPEEWMNEGGAFFPFVPDSSERAVILNKRYIVVLTVTEGYEALNLPEETGVSRYVQVKCGSLEIEGLVYIDMPDTHRRLTDWVNRPEPFLMLREGELRHLIQKSRITFLTEPAEELP